MRSNDHGEQKLGSDQLRPCSSTWLSSIHSATAVLRISNDATQTPNIADVTPGLDYLNEMETALKKLRKHWDKPPVKSPPPFHDQDDLQSFQMTPTKNATPMVMLRILIRVLTSQGELLALKANQYRYAKPLPQWTLGADTYCESLRKINEALHVTDSECARQLQAMQVAQVELVDDANIVEVAIQYLVEGRDKFREAADKQERRLREKLEEHLRARERARQRSQARAGSSNTTPKRTWSNNTAPKNNYRIEFQQVERELKDVKAALFRLDQMELPNRVKQQLPPKQRYNGERPWDLSRRRPFDSYPDPTEFGWIFTGSWNNTVEFFERMEDNDSIVKLDWYFTTGTIKTSLDHPVQGHTQMFGAEVSPTVYKEILFNPRAHTDVRYQTVKGKKRSA